MRRALLFGWLLLTPLLSAQRKVAITIDDLPRGGDDPEGRTLEAVLAVNQKLLGPLRGVPVIGFVNAGRVANIGVDGLQQVLGLWLQSGATLGNHTFGHLNVNQVGVAAYEADVIKGEAALRKATGTAPKYFRHPFLFTGKTAEDKWAIDRFLADRGYTVAPITIDTSDYVFASVYANALKSDAAKAAKVRDAYLEYIDNGFAFFEQRSKEVIGREVAQTLLIHVSQLNADSMPALLDIMRKRGYAFVSLAEALRDPAYQLPDDYVATRGISWIHRWGVTKGMPIRWEPDEPKWISDEYKALNGR